MIFLMIKPFRHHHIIQILEGYSEQSLPLDIFLNQYYRTHKALGSKDRLYIGDAAFAIIRWCGLLDAQIEGPIDWEKRVDLFFSKPLEELQKHPSLKDHEKVSFPEWLFHLLVKQVGAPEASRICLISNQPAPRTVRVNLLKSNRASLFESLKKYGDVQETKISSTGIIFPDKINYFEIPEFCRGEFEVQDEGSQLLADLLNPKPGDQVLDYCSGSGGKTLAFAHKMQGKGQIYLHDVRPKVLQQAKKRLKRAGIQNAQGLLEGDPKLKKLKGKMDLVFVDAPCSGTGTFRRNPDMKWKLEQEDITSLVGLQRSIFEKALSFLKPEGFIVYGTCSLLKEENEDQVAHFIKTYGLEPVKEPLHIYPQENGPDGFYGIILKRTHERRS